MNFLDLLAFLLLNFLDFVEDVLKRNSYRPFRQRQLHDIVLLFCNAHLYGLIIYQLLIIGANYSPQFNSAQRIAEYTPRKLVVIQANKYNLMRSSKAVEIKQKKAKSGNSEFTRAKLEDEYQPKVRFFKGNVMSMMDIPEEEKHQNKSKEEAQICSKAINTIKEGFSIKIDWSTRTNFRTTKSLLPKLKTQPAHHNISVSEPNGKKWHEGSSIEERQVQLSKLLFNRHKKKYMITKKEQQQQIKLFGHSRIRHTSPHKLGSKNPEDYLNFSETKKMKTPKENKSIFDVQEQLLNTSKLTVLKDELKSKFYEIRQSFTKKKRFKKHLFLNFNDLTGPSP